MVCFDLPRVDLGLREKEGQPEPEAKLFLLRIILLIEHLSAGYGGTNRRVVGQSPVFPSPALRACWSKCVCAGSSRPNGSLEANCHCWEVLREPGKSGYFYPACR